MYLKYWGKGNSSHEVVPTPYVSFLDLLKMDIQNLNIQHKKIHTTYTYKHAAERMGLLREINKVVKGKMQTKTKQNAPEYFA